MNKLRIFPKATAVAEALVTRASQLPTSAISDAMERNPGAVGLHPVGDSLQFARGNSLAGTALTVRTRPGDNLAVHHALELIQPGDVLVIDARGELTNAILGELMTAYASMQGAVGIVVDGAIRDAQSLSESGPIPVYCRGISHLGPYKSGPGEIHGSVNIGGLVVSDGDLVVGDQDGLAFISPSRIEAAITGAEQVVAKEEQQAKDIYNSAWDRSWLIGSADIEYVEYR